MKQDCQFSKKVIFTFLLSLTIFITHNKFSQAQNTGLEKPGFSEYYGSVVDISTKKILVFADIVVKGTNISTITNSEGEFSLKIPDNITNKVVIVSYLGYESLEFLIADSEKDKIKIALEPSITQLEEVKLNVPKNAVGLVRATLKTKGDNYLNTPTLMTAFYRETIKKRRKNASLSEAVLEIYKQPYSAGRRDAIKLIKSRKNTNYSRLDTLALKLQGGPFSALYADLIKYPQYLFPDGDLNLYQFKFEKSTQIDNRRVYVVSFKQKSDVDIPLYYGKLFIDGQSFALTSAIYNLNLIDRAKATAMFVRRKPRNVDTYPIEAGYRVNYRVKDGKWHYGYSSILLTFKVNWKRKLFNSIYTLQSEMAITDWEQNTSGINRPKDALRPSIIFADEASGFSDPEFWGEFNIIEPEKSIESAIKKISKQVKRNKG
ncbi:MAG: carboxypeptidase-like regulatory domain-containing protein [Flavobacteriaceae bacterium]|nr:carboxypeptidase-like regulatory domain-containing protein [Bacteroidia bacterium]NNL16554.1 carboxypeptidase-like regulatory domain-containing protein [Flavobacteriaceae bacterium]